MTSKTSEVINRTDMSDFLLEYDRLINFIKDTLGYNNISKTKLYKFRSKLEQNNFDFDDECELYANLNRFKRIKDILDLKRDDLNRDTLRRMLAGSENVPFYSDASDDAFFEFDFAQRLTKLPTYKSININTEADIIFNDFIVIECKKIHSKKSFEKNIREANNQIEKRIVGGLCKIGFIAIDITNVLNHQVIRTQAKNAYSLFHDEYIKLKNTESECIDQIPHDNNFRSIVYGFSSAFLEFAFHSMINSIYKNFTLNENIMGIFFQAETFIPITTTNHKLPIAQRFGSYHINENFVNCRNGQKTADRIGAFFRSLASGI